VFHFQGLAIGAILLAAMALLFWCGSVFLERQHNDGEPS
jgi:hypothetical protein